MALPACQRVSNAYRSRSTPLVAPRTRYGRVHRGLAHANRTRPTRRFRNSDSLAPQRQCVVRFKESDREIEAKDVPFPTEEGGRNILLAVDESEESEYIIDYALRNIFRKGDRVTLMRVVPALPMQRVYTRLQGNLMPLSAAAKQAKQAEVANNVINAIDGRFGAKMRSADAPYEVEVLFQPAEGGMSDLGGLVCSKVAELDAGIVVVPEGSNSGLSRWVHGSLAHHLAHHCERAVAVLHRPRGAAKGPAAPLSAAPGARSILIAVDESEESEDAVLWAADNLYREGDVLHLLHVIPVIGPAPFGDWLLHVEPATPPVQADEEEAAWRERMRARFEHLLGSRGIKHQFDILTDVGEDAVESVARVIAATGESLDAAAVVMVQHSRPGDFGAFLMGDVVDDVLDWCSRPVLLLHGSDRCEV